MTDHENYSELNKEIIIKELAVKGILVDEKDPIISLLFIQDYFLNASLKKINILSENNHLNFFSMLDNKFKVLNKTINNELTSLQKNLTEKNDSDKILSEINLIRISIESLNNKQDEIKKIMLVFTSITALLLIIVVCYILFKF